MCFSPLPADQEHMESPGYLESTLPQRSIITEWKVGGNRWRDWKRGNGKDALRRLLCDAAPDKDRPVTLVSAVMIGTAVARAVNLSRAA